MREASRVSMRSAIYKLQSTDDSLLLILFGLSGVAALVYQVCWQRLLFAAFGVDVESITIIVSVFMLGLGTGALLGGILADSFPNRILPLFASFEFAIGTFGLMSPFLITWVADRFVMASRAEMAITIFFLLLLPTIFMGSTLPMLVIYVNKTHDHIGISIGTLYFFNTLGASLGSFITGFILFHFFTLNQTIYFAAVMNFTVAGLMFRKRISA